jgi:hypothetical protein
MINDQATTLTQPYNRTTRSLLTSKTAQILTIPKHTTRKTCRVIKNIPAPAQQLQNGIAALAENQTRQL